MKRYGGIVPLLVAWCLLVEFFACVSLGHCLEQMVHDVGTIYQIEVQSTPDGAAAFSFPDSDWNLVGTEHRERRKRTGPSLAGWRVSDDIMSSSVTALSYFDSVGDTVDGFSRRMVDGGAEATLGHGLSADGKSTFEFVDVKDVDEHLYMGRFRHHLEGRTSIIGGIMLASERLAHRDGVDLFALGVPATAARFGVETAVGNARVWGSFQVNDWNSVTDAPGSSSEPVSGLLSASTALAKSSSSSVGTEGGGDFGAGGDSTSDAFSFEVGAAFPAERGHGSVRYRRSSDGTPSGGGAIERQQVGLQGEVTLQKDVRLKAGFERIYSSSGFFDQEESNVWTSIEIQF